MNRNSAAEGKLSTLSREKALLLERLLKRDSNQTPTIKRYLGEDLAGDVRLPVSWAQERLWFIDQVEGVGAAYNEMLAVRLRGALDPSALEHALQLLVERHEILRTSFFSDEGSPKQRIAGTGSWPLLRVDLRALPAVDRVTQMQAQKVEEGRLPFDIKAGPLVRARLLRLRDDLHILIIAMHHIVSDGWSMGVLIRELSELYSASADSREYALQPLPIQYSDYAQWQREWLSGPIYEGQLHYWREHLQGVAPELELPTDRPRRPAFRYRGANVSVFIDDQLTGQLREHARQHSLTLFMVLYAAWAILLSRLSGQEDVVIGTPVANRRRPELENLIGFFVSTLPLRAELKRTATLAEVLQQVRQTTLGAYDNQDIPFEHIVEALRPPRSLGRHPIFQVVFGLQSSTPSSLWALSGLEAESEELDNETSKFDLTLLLEERGGEISGCLNYDTDLFDLETVQRWIGCFDELLRSMIDGSSKQIGDLRILPERERRQILESFNATQALFPKQYTHQIFEQQVRRAPDAVAVIYEGQVLTYADVNARANRLAHYLSAQGTQAGEYVPIVMQRCLQMLIAQIAILKCGAAYVPIDPAIPLERQALMIKDCGARRIITDREVRVALETEPVQCLSCMELDQAISVCSPQNLEAQLHGRLAAYVMYTSGSTGVPKGVVVPHHAVNRLAINNGYAEIAPTDCMAHYSNPAFDASTFEIWGALLNGARVVVIPREIVLEPRRFAEVLERQKVTHLWMTMGLFVQYADSLAGVFRHFKYLIVGGDVVDPEVVRRVMRNGPPRRLLNGYGPTECTTFSTTYLIETLDEDARTVPIGRPISNAQIYILDNSLQPVPIGVAGAIYIGGAGVALGYLNRPQLTSDRFIRDPFSSDHEARLYNSGDLGRWRADGNVEFVGRNDQQVKIRGFRIELGEIETQLVRHENVREAAVIVREDVPGDKRLVAYVILRDSQGAGGESGAEALRAHAKALLPEYMLPSAFVTLERMPLTVNGKVDRHALPAPALEAYASRQYESPQGEVEEILAGIWQALLKVERVGRQDNFFELGGHSLLIVQMMERLRQIGLSTDVRSIYESATLGDLARTLAHETVQLRDVPPNLIPPNCSALTPQMLNLVELNEQQIEHIVRSVPGGVENIRDIYPLAPLQEGILFHHLLDSERGDTYVLPRLFAVASRKRLDDLIAALQAVIDHHDSLRTAVLWEHLPTPVQVVHRSATLPVVEVALNGNSEPVTEWMRPERQRMDLRVAPLVRLQIGSDSSDCWYALLQLHHIAIDHVAIEAMTAEIVALLDSRALCLPEPAPYREHVARALAHTRSQDSESFFRKKFAEVAEPTAPFGLLDVHRDGTRIQDAYQELDVVLSQRIRTQAQRLSVSAATLFHAAWSLVLAHTTGRDDVVFGSVLLGRLQVDANMQRTLGMFINTLPLRLQLRDVTAKNLVRQTQRELIELLGHEQASLSAAQRCSGVYGSTPLFSTLLNYRHSVPKPEAQWARADGIRTIATLERTNYPITFSIDDLDDRFRLKAQTDCSVDPRRITDYVSTSLVSLVTALEQAPQTPALALAILPERERRQILESFNTTAVPVSAHEVVYELFEERTRSDPYRVALVHDGRSLSYRELNEKANRLARHLRARGVVANQLVGICIERSTEMVVALLAILKAGAAYVPLDPSYPRERLSYMLNDAALQIVLTHGRSTEVLPSTSAEIVDLSCLSYDGDSVSGENLSVADPAFTSESLVYVIYTSGSTGQPKGVAMPHRAMLNLIGWHRRSFACNEGLRVLQFAALSFDVAFQEIFSTLCSGCTLVLLDEWIRRDAHALMDLLNTQSIQRLFVPPLVLQNLAEHFGATGVCAPSLRDVVVAGEQLRVSPQIVAFFRSMDGSRLHNHYGPTETHVVTAATLEGDPGEWPQLPTIGYPIDNTQIYILDGRRNAVPIGVQGEIYVASANIARGYLKRQGLTDERFVCNPFDRKSESRMYRTGDVGRWRADGTIEYLGRNDDQVKIRGFRIELGEIETLLGEHSQVKEAVVVAREDGHGAQRLFAYVTPRDVATLSAEDLRTYLKTTLPDYMVPSGFMMLERMPLTPSGKLDRRSLPVPEFAALTSNDHEPPRGELERDIAKIWKEVLQIDQVGRDDDFFELGGHSLLVLKALIRVNQSRGCDLRVRDMYAAPTLKELAARVSGGTTEYELIDLEQEAKLDDAIVAAPGLSRPFDNAVLLTGATGLVGRFLLAELLQETKATIYCLVRAGSQQEAQSRLRSALMKWDLWRDEAASRLVAVQGDLRLPRFGINERTYRVLLHGVDSVYHCATSMNHLETYAMAKRANVDAIQELLKLATQGQPKLVNYISTLGVFGAVQSDDKRVVTEETSIDHERHWSSQGYLASKWVGEKIFMTARERGIPCNIFRLGLVWADAERGRFDEQQNVYMVLKSCLLSGYGIESYRYPLPPVPVDYVARSIVFLANRYRGEQRTFHIAGTEDAPVRGVFERVSEIVGRPLELMSYYKWINEMKRLHRRGRPIPAVPLIEFAFDMDEVSFERHQRSRRSSANVCFDCTQTRRELEKANIIAPPLGDDLIRVCLESMFSRDVELRQIDAGANNRA